MKSGSTLSCSQQPATGLCLKPAEFSPDTSCYFKMYLILSSHLCLGLPSGLFPSGFAAKLGIMKWKLNETCGKICGTDGTFNIWPHTNWVLLWINMAENRNCPTTSSRVSYMELSQYLCNGFGASARSYTYKHTWPPHNVSHSTS
jgi:hypothetical protein